ncbi:hypothetical protein Hsar01_03227 [Haloferula sargassicola]|uniref:DUF3800 domain-containing protein n=2 Tax=Haloferula sargassicola TaxID=490096 RepID=A0ABP9UR16_9BACT
MDESGHDHRQMPYEVRGGFALAEHKLWPLLQDAGSLELECFGARLVDYGSEIKGSKLLKKDRFKHAAQDEPLDPESRRHLCRGYLQAGLDRRSPKRDQFTAYGQASLAMADGIFDLLERHGARVFASAVPRGAANPPPGTTPLEILRKDHTFLLERFFYFLEMERQCGILVMDEVEEKYDRRFVRKLEQYFTKTAKGLQRAKWIVPSPFFVSSSMALPVQMADVVIYALNWGYRRPGEMDAPDRPEIAARYGRRINSLKWRGDGYDGVKTYRSFGIVCVPDLYEAREPRR